MKTLISNALEMISEDPETSLKGVDVILLEEVQYIIRAYLQEVDRNQELNFDLD